MIPYIPVNNFSVKFQTLKTNILFENRKRKVVEIFKYLNRNMMVCATSKGSDQPAHMRSLIRAFTSLLNIL